MRTRISRRRFLAAGALSPAALPLAAAIPSESRRVATAATPTATDPPGIPADQPATEAVAVPANPGPGAWARWLDDRALAAFSGATWGMPWPRGRHRPETRFSLRTSGNAFMPVQTWPLAYWPDGSVKWTAHAVPARAALGDGPFEIVPDRAPITASAAVTVTEDDASITVDTGEIRCSLPRAGRVIISSVSRQGRELIRDGRLVLLRQDRPRPEAGGTVAHEPFESVIEQIAVEQRGPVRAVVRVEGRHASPGGRQWLPFTLRLYFYAGSEAVRVMHTMIFDGDEHRDFIRGAGLRFTTPLPYPLHDRHVRFAGEGSGVSGEAVRGLTGLRRDPGEAARREQIEGRAVTSIAPVVARRLDLIPAFGDWTLLQPTADSFLIRKRTADGHAWLDADRGRRSSGLGYVGGPDGGVAFGIRNFWQSHPAQLDIRQAASDGESEAADVTLWLWAPDAPPMDLRFYHDGMGQDTFEQQLEGLEITYEDYEPGFGTPMGVARTSEMSLWLLPATPGRDRVVQLAEALTAPAVIVATPQTLQESGVFGRMFGPPARANARQAAIEERLDWLFDFYRRQQDERGWYGFWHYGDVMHTYDADRHVWRYDVGGYAWDNSELSTDIWLWLYFLRTGRPDVFRFAEAMTRHTGEVDVHHLGRFAPLGSRHNVMHWGCSAKQLRISTVVNRRYYYYLTGDERVGDLMREQVDAARALRTIEPERKLPDAKSRPRADPDGDRASLAFGLDWGSIASAWLTEWERTGNPEMRARLEAGMRSIAAQPRGFFTRSGWMNLRTGAFEIATDPAVRVSHLSAAFGLPEVCAELIELLPIEEFERAWLLYCELYNASAAEQEQALGQPLGPLNLGQGHARLTAYAAYRKGDAALAARAWDELDAGRAGFPADRSFAAEGVEPPAVLNPVEEAAWMSTNGAAQWGLAAIECLALAGPPATPPALGPVLFRDDFRGGLAHWRQELERPGSITASGGVLDIDVPAGTTLWFEEELRSPVAIVFEATAVAADGPNDRVSDLNCFWMARNRDGSAPYERRRSGAFAEYHDLLTYYVGLGGNTNTTTRFRRYIGDPDQRPMLPAHDLSAAETLLVPNRTQTITLVADGSTVEYWRDDRRLFHYTDAGPYTRGWFALRTTQSHLRIERFRVHALAPEARRERDQVDPMALREPVRGLRARS